MSEYIIRTTNMPEHVREAISTWYEIDCEIVRCRDCGNYHPDEGRLMRCRFEIDGFVQWRNAEADGFCAWGSRRDA